MKKLIVMIFKILIGVLLMLNNTSTYSQNIDTIEVSNSKENDKFEVSVLSYFEENTLCLKIEKTLPIDKFDNKSDYRSEYMYQITNSQKAIIHLYFNDSKLVKGVFEKKAMKRIFKNGFQKRGDIVKENITIDQLNIESDKIEGTMRIQLPFSFGWLDSDALVKVNFKTKIYNLPSKVDLNPGLVQSYSIKPNLIDGLAKVYYKSCTIEKDTLNSTLNFNIGFSDGLASNLVHIKIPNERKRAIEVSSSNYSDIEDEICYHYPYHKLEFNRNPFIESDIPLIGKYLIATDSLPGKYGDPEIRSGYFKCE